MDATTFFIIFGVVLFIILYNSFKAAAWHKYHKIDERILAIKGESVFAKFISAKKVSERSKYYEVTLVYAGDNEEDEEKYAQVASYQKLTKQEVSYIKKNQPVRALAYEDVIELDLSDMVDDGGEVEFMPSAILGALATFLFPFFSKRCGFPPKHPRKSLLKELEQDEEYS